MSCRFFLTTIFASQFLGNVISAELPSDWKNVQQLEIRKTELIKLSLPVETLDAAKAGLEDLRIFDPDGHEVPYFLDRPIPAQKPVRNPKSFHVSLQPGSTIIHLETGLEGPTESVVLETPALNFIKPIQIEASMDRKSWKTLARGVPIFREPNGAQQTRLNLPLGNYAFFRITVDDQRSEPIPFSGAKVYAAEKEALPSEAVPLIIQERTEMPGETRLAITLPTSHLVLSSLEIETPELLFTRSVNLASRQLIENGIKEYPLSNGSIYRMKLEGQPVSSKLDLDLDVQSPSRDLIILIRNNDSPPLQITNIRARRRPVYAVFVAQKIGSYSILVGNAQADASRYDVTAFRNDLKRANVNLLQVGILSSNPSYRPPKALPQVEQIEELGTELNVSNWKYRKLITVSKGGVQQIDLDLEVISHAATHFGDLRLVRDGKQCPYILEQTSIQREFTPVVTSANDSSKKSISRWKIQLPQKSLPLTHLICNSSSPIFKRTVILFEELLDDRGGSNRRYLGQSTWVKTPGQTNRDFMIHIDGQPFTDQLFLEIENGDNPAIQLENIRFFYPLTRILFLKQSLEGNTFLYYGNSKASTPDYDISLISSQFLAASKQVASLSAEEQVKETPWSEKPVAKNSAGIIFWGVLALIVLVLLVVISRLLPKSS
jgi:hypothetical protein